MIMIKRKEIQVAAVVIHNDVFYINMSKDNKHFTLDRVMNSDRAANQLKSHIKTHACATCTVIWEIISQITLSVSCSPIRTVQVGLGTKDPGKG